MQVLNILYRVCVSDESSAKMVVLAPDWLILFRREFFSPGHLPLYAPLNNDNLITADRIATKFCMTIQKIKSNDIMCYKDIKETMLIIKY